MRISLFVLIFLSFGAYGYTQANDKNKYRQESEAIRKGVWAWKKDEFNVKDVPAQYANSSKVIIARHTELTAESKSKIAFYGFTVGGKKELTINEIAREVIKINDKKAVEEYSELSFTQFEKTSGFFTTDKTTVYIGLRVIKPNGTIIEINGDDIVLTKNESTEKKAKLAVPDLAPGDILDYFIATEQMLTNSRGSTKYQVLLFDDAPILYTSFHAQLGKKYAIEYGSYNGAPGLNVEKNDDGEIIVDIAERNIPAFETALWVSPARQLPFIRMYISLGYRGIGSSVFSKPGEVIKSTNGEIGLEDKGKQLSLEYYDRYWWKASKAQFAELEKKAIDRSKKMGLTYRKMTDEEKAAILYYTLRFDYLLKFEIDKMAAKINIGNLKLDADFMCFCMLKVAGLNPAILVSDYKNGYRFTDAMEEESLTSATYLQESKKFVTLSSIYDIPFDIPENIEGSKTTRSVTFEHPIAITTFKKMEALSKINPGIEVPQVESDKNVRSETIALRIQADKSMLAAKRRTVVKGYYKNDLQRKLILYEDYYESERKLFKEEKSLIETLEADKKSNKFVDEVKNAFAEARKKQKEEFVDEAKSWFEQDITDLQDYNIENYGVRHDSPDFIFSSAFNLGGLLKKGGNNIILEIGKIIGTQVAIKDEQRKRTLDVYMPFARTIEYNIEIEIPDGYTVEGISTLNSSIKNETGSFLVTAKKSDKLIQITLSKSYTHSFETADKFPQLAQVVDAAIAWGNSKLLFKRN